MNHFSTQTPSSIQPLPNRSLFQLGKLLATPGALDMLRKLNRTPFEFTERHRQGDWGDLDQEDINANNQALLTGARLLSAYRIDADTKLWIITEADRKATTLLLPEEY
jgi:hypothetical protein